MILVTGGAGFIGSNLVAGLNERGVGDIAIADQIDGAKRKNLDKRRYAETVAPADLLRWLEGRKLGAILHMGAISSTTVTDEAMVMRNNFELPVQLLEWCTATRTPFIYASSAATYGDGAAGFDDDDSPQALSKLKPLNLYGRSNARFDLFAAERARSGGKMPPQWVGLKYFNVFGPNEYHKDEMRSVVCKAFPVAKAGKPVRLFASDRAGILDGGHARDFIYVNDVAAVSLWLLDNPRVSGIYNVGTGRARSFNDLIRAFRRSASPDRVFRDAGQPARPYQHRTEARMERLRAAGYDAPFTPLETAVETSAHPRPRRPHR
jgi:ADP-L-glycero-D-manno-heptose 6-epimerase